MEKKKGEKLMRQCNYCKAENADDAVYCGNCGKRIDGKIQCPNCGEYSDPTETFCMKCGTRIDGKVVCECGELVSGNFCPKCGKKIGTIDEHMAGGYCRCKSCDQYFLSADVFQNSDGSKPIYSTEIYTYDGVALNRIKIG